MGNFKIKSIWENKNTGGGNVPAGLENRLQAVEQKASTNETSINNLNNEAVKKTGDQSIAGVKTFTQPLTIPTPTANTNATTKEYVDNRIKKRILTITNTAGNTYIIQPTSGYEIISVMVGRKRTAEGYYFFNYQSSLNFQLFMDTNGAYKLYTEGAVSGFNGDYKIIVVEMKV